MMSQHMTQQTGTLSTSNQGPQTNAQLMSGTGAMEGGQNTFVPGQVNQGPGGSVFMSGQQQQQQAQQQGQQQV